MGYGDDCPRCNPAALPTSASRAQRASGIVVRASCAVCGTIDLHPANVRMVARPGAEAVYTYACPSCLEQHVKPAPAEVVTLLESGGVETITLPAAVVLAGELPSVDDALPALAGADAWLAGLTGDVQ